MGKKDDDGGYCFDILKEGLTDITCPVGDELGVLVSVLSERLLPILLSGLVRN